MAADDASKGILDRPPSPLLFIGSLTHQFLPSSTHLASSCRTCLSMHAGREGQQTAHLIQPLAVDDSAVMR
eukprot:10382848-Alexandrium_andersonii.AAC.1